MSDRAEKICSSCGERPATGQIYFSHPLPEREQAKYKAERAEVDMLLCESCGESAFRHLRRMLPDRHLGFDRRNAAAAAEGNQGE